jgi:hypothetical protein
MKKNSYAVCKNQHIVFSSNQLDWALALLGGQNLVVKHAVRARGGDVSGGVVRCG